MRIRKHDNPAAALHSLMAAAREGALESEDPKTPNELAS